MDDLRKQKTEREQMNELQGIKVDVDFQVMVENNMKNVQPMQPHIPADQLKICVCVKKRPIFKHELSSGEIDCVSSSNPLITVHECKYKVDGITKVIDNQEFYFDNAFSHEESNLDLYDYSVRPILDLVFNQGIVTVFAYGQTGSGKTFSMQGLQDLAIRDLFDRGVSYFQNHNRNFTVTVAMYEIYGGKIYDLLNNHETLKILEDKNNKIQIHGLKEQFVQSEEEIGNLISFGNSVRTTHATKANDSSSRSHAICQIKIHEEGVKNPGKLLLVDLAGSERAQDCQSNNKDRQQEGAEINKSLLALKECVRALDSQKGQASQGQHVPFRSSKLTMVLRDSFLLGEKNKIIMLACICPGSSSADHTLNTLRYAERLKERNPNLMYQMQQHQQQQQQLQQLQQQQNQQPNAMFPSQLDEQLRLFKKTNSQTNLDVLLSHAVDPHSKFKQGAGTTVPGKFNPSSTQKSAISRESAPHQPNKDQIAFYPNSQQIEENGEDSDEDLSDQQDVLMVSANQAQLSNNDNTPQARKFIPTQQQNTKIRQQASPDTTTAQTRKPAPQQKEQPISKHNFTQQPSRTNATQNQGVVLNKNQTKQIQNKYQEQLQQQQQQQKQAPSNKLIKPNDDSYLSDEMTGITPEHNHHQAASKISPHGNHPKQPLSQNNVIMPKRQQETIVAGGPSKQHHFQQNATAQPTPKYGGNQLIGGISSAHNSPPLQISHLSQQQDDDLLMQDDYYNNPNMKRGENQQVMMDEDDEDSKIAAEESILNGHLECVKVEAQLITQEGEMITKIERSMINDVNYDMRGYLQRAEQIARMKLDMYSKLLADINEFKSRFGHDY